MNRISTQILIGAAYAGMFALTPAMAQHEGHGHRGGDHPHAQKPPSPVSLPNCPVMDEPINLAVSVVTDDGPVFFCCEDCVSKYQANPPKYAAKVAEQRKALADRPKVQVICPVSNDPVDQDVYVENNGNKVYFCCKGCINKYEKDPAKYASALANGYTYQTKCPVMGEDIDPKAFAKTANGTRFYFCCDGCDKEFFKDPKKYAPNLAAQGFTVKSNEMVHDADGHSGDDHGSHDHAGHDH